jgi:8-oxo-dGTP pyrophosphatase MutT (NUDIX family)
MKPRAAVILIQNDRIALIERHKSGRHYFVFPGGKIELDERAADAAKREALEELGLEVNIGRMLAEVWFQGAPQYYFLAEAIGGQFGHGTGSELASQPGSAKGSYHPLWMRLEEITNHPVLPELMAEFVRKSHPDGWPEVHLVVTDPPTDEPV